MQSRVRGDGNVWEAGVTAGQQGVARSEVTVGVSGRQINRTDLNKLLSDYDRTPSLTHQILEGPSMMSARQESWHCHPSMGRCPPGKNFFFAWRRRV